MRRGPSEDLHMNTRQVPVKVPLVQHLSHIYDIVYLLG